METNSDYHGLSEREGNEQSQPARKVTINSDEFVRRSDLWKEAAKARPPQPDQPRRPFSFLDCEIDEQGYFIPPQNQVD